jgi:hypothetical protein
MSVRFAVVHEADADFQTATELADRVLVEAIDWLVLIAVWNGATSALWPGARSSCPPIQICNRRLGLAQTAARSPCVDPRHSTADSVAQVYCCGMEILVCRRCVKVKVIAGGAAAKAAIDTLVDIGGEAPAPSRCRSMNRASATHFFAGRFPGHKAQQVQNLCHGDTRTNFVKAQAWHRSSRRPRRC